MDFKGINPSKTIIELQQTCPDGSVLHKLGRWLCMDIGNEPTLESHYFKADGQFPLDLCLRLPLINGNV
ncbi:hypothetical protein T07_5934 [Trichinella nelsoni]|uniref:Uncharacterized protein n=1 Tax=Trichinella nelsoni TaxID=6336 RepID=A0A0V0RNI5_9BILA|nr:hypothetical protein T07_5934 [Trichinella nelsoni]